MAIATFKLGKLEIEGTSITNLISGTGTVTHNVEDTNPIGSSWRAGTVLGGEWEVSLEAHYDPAATAQAALVTNFITGGDSCILTTVALYALAASYALTGSAIITNATISKTHGSADKLSVTLRGNGTPTYV